MRSFGERKIEFARERGSSPTVREGVFTWIILTPLLTRGLLPRLIQIVNLKANRTGAGASDAVKHAHDFAVRN